MSINRPTIQTLEELYPFGVPERLVREAVSNIKRSSSGAANQSGAVTFSGASAARFNLLFRSPPERLDAVRDVVQRAISQGLKKAVQEILLGECAYEARAVSLEHTTPRVVLACLPPEVEIVDTGSAVILRTEEITRVLDDAGAKRSFWTALQGAWELSQRAA